MTDEQIESLYRHNVQECEACVKKLDFKRELELDTIKESIRKETAKEILEKIKHIKLNFNIEDFHTDNGILVHLLELEIHKAYEAMRDNTTKQIDEIANEYGVEVEE